MSLSQLYSLWKDYCVEISRFLEWYSRKGRSLSGVSLLLPSHCSFTDHAKILSVRMCKQFPCILKSISLCMVQGLLEKTRKTDWRIVIELLLYAWYCAYNLCWAGWRNNWWKHPSFIYSFSNRLSDERSMSPLPWQQSLHV